MTRTESIPTRGESVSVGIDLGGTGTRFAAITATGQVVGRFSSPTPRTLTRSARHDFLRAGIVEAASGHPIGRVGIGASGPVDPDGIIRNPDTLPAFTDVPLASELEAEFGGVSVSIDNDAVAAAIAEYEIGAAPEAPALLHVTLGTGIGTALLLKGEPFRGGDNRHPEGGHLSTRIPTRPCYCGRLQCWEQAASRTALQTTAAAYLNTPDDDPTVIARLTSEVERGDKGARAIFSNYGAAVADGLATLLELYRPTHVILGGSAGIALPHFQHALSGSLAPLRAWIPEPTIAASALDDHGGALGAALLALRAGRTPHNVDGSAPRE
jgi:glucokinase